MYSCCRLSWLNILHCSEKILFPLDLDVPIANKVGFCNCHLNTAVDVSTRRATVFLIVSEFCYQVRDPFVENPRTDHSPNSKRLTRNILAETLVLAEESKSASPHLAYMNSMLLFSARSCKTSHMLLNLHSSSHFQGTVIETVMVNFNELLVKQ